MQLEAALSMKAMVDLLKQSGVVETDNNWILQPIANADADDEYPYIFNLATNISAPFNTFSTPGYSPFNHFAQTGYESGTTPLHVIHTAVQYANVVDVEGLGLSQGILFRIAKDSDHPDVVRGMAVPKGNSITTDANGMLPIEWGNEYHAITVVRNTSKTYATHDYGYNELVHLVWDNNKNPKSKTVLATHVSRLIFEVLGLPAPPPSSSIPNPWPLPSARGANTGETSGAWTAAMTAATWPPPPKSPFEIRITLCLAKPSDDNPENSLYKKDRLKVVWQQANVNMRSIKH